MIDVDYNLPFSVLHTSLLSYPTDGVGALSTLTLCVPYVEGFIESLHWDKMSTALPAASLVYLSYALEY